MWVCFDAAHANTQPARLYAQLEQRTWTAVYRCLAVVFLAYPACSEAMGLPQLGALAERAWRAWRGHAVPGMGVSG